MLLYEYQIAQPAGSGQGYFFAPGAPGVIAFVELENEGYLVLRLVIQRFNDAPIIQDVLPGKSVTIGSNHILNVGILVLPGLGYTIGYGELTVTVDDCPCR